MRQLLCPRIKKRSAAVLALAMAGAFAVGLIAYAATAAADPPPCNPGFSATDNRSCVNFEVLPSNPHATLTASSLLRAHAHQLRPSG